jgi:hypothetical protein
MKLAQKVALFCPRVPPRITALFSKERTAAYAFDMFCTPPAPSVTKQTQEFQSVEQLTWCMEGIKVQVLWIYDTEHQAPFTDTENVRGKNHPNVHFVIKSDWATDGYTETCCLRGRYGLSATLLR